MEYLLAPDEPVVEAVVTAVGRRTDRSPLSLPPLQETIDTDALTSLFDGDQDDGVRCLSFVYVGHLVTVTGDTVLVDSTAEIPTPE